MAIRVNDGRLTIFSPPSMAGSPRASTAGLKSQSAAGAAEGMSEIRKRLEAIGLGRYADALDAREIRMNLLGQVDD